MGTHPSSNDEKLASQTSFSDCEADSAHPGETYVSLPASQICRFRETGDFWQRETIRERCFCRL
jgi:hypothetical protein